MAAALRASHWRRGFAAAGGGLCAAAAAVEVPRGRGGGAASAAAERRPSPPQLRMRPLGPWGGGAAAAASSWAAGAAASLSRGEAAPAAPTLAPPAPAPSASASARRSRRTASGGVLCEECSARFVHEENFTPEMQRVVGKVDFHRILEETSFVMEGVDPEVVDKLVEFAGTKVVVPRGETVIEQGNDFPYLVVVGYGHLGVEVNGEPVSYIVPGQLVGEFSFLRKKPAVATLRVISDLAYILMLDHASVTHILGPHQDVFDRMQVLLHQRELQRKAASFVGRR